LFEIFFPLNFTHRRIIYSYRRFGTIYRVQSQGAKKSKKFCLIFPRATGTRGKLVRNWWVRKRG